MFSLGPGVEQVGKDEWWGNIKNAGSDSPDGVWDSLGNGTSKGPLLKGGDVVLGCATNGGKFAEAFRQTSQRQLHGDILSFLENLFYFTLPNVVWCLISI